MGYKSIADIRRAWGDEWRDASDEEILGAYSKAAKLDVGQVADAFGYDPGKGSLARERIAGGIDNYQSGWWETGAAVAHGLGLDGVKQFAERKAADNRFQAEVAGARARQLGGIDSYEDVDGVSSGLNYLGGLAAQSLPYAVEALVGGWVGRGVGATAKGLQLASQAGRAADATQDVITAGRAAEAALGRRGMVGATVASYPSSVGDILGNQREQIEANGGEMNYGSAFAGGVPYSLLNGALGIEGALGRGQLARSGVKLLDDMMGVRGIAARTGASVGRQMAEEGASELGQEFVNQYFGRMAVDPNETFYNDESGKRFRESFVGGAALGGAFGAVGGHRRSQDYYDRQRTPNPDQSTPREDWTTSQGFEDLLLQKDERQFDVPEWATTQGFEGVRGLRIPPVDAQGLYADINETTPLNNVKLVNELGVPDRPRVSNTVYGDNGIDFTPMRVYVAGNSDASGMGGIGGRLGQGAYMSDEDMMNDPGAVIARVAQEKARQDQASLAAELKADDARKAAERKDATDFGVAKKSQMEAIARLAAHLFPEATPGALFAHVAAQDRDASAYRQFMENLRLIKDGNVKSVLNWISATAENAKVQAEVSKAEIEAPINNLKAQAEAKNVSKRVPDVAQAPVDGGRGGAVDAGSQPAGGPGAVPGTVGAADTTTGTPAPGATGVAVRAGGGDGGAVADKKTPVSKTVKGFDSYGKPITVDLTYVDDGRTLYSVVVNAADGTSKEVGFKPETRAPDVVRALRKNGVLYDTVSGNTATVGRAGRQKVVTKKDLEKQLKGATAVELRAVKLALGLDGSWEPASYGPLSAPQISAVLAKTRMTNGELSRTSIKNILDKFGITQDVLTQFGAHDFSVDESSADAEDYATYEDREKVLSESKVNERTLSSDERNAVDGDTGRDGVFDSVDAEDAEDEDTGYEHMDAESTSGKSGTKSGGEGGALRRAHIGLTALLKAANAEGGLEFSADHVRILENAANTAEKALAPDDTGVLGSRLNRAQNALKHLRKTLELPIWSDSQRELLEPLIGSAKKVNSAIKVDDVVSAVANEGVVTEEQKAMVARNEAIIAQNAKLIEEFNADLTKKVDLRSKAERVREIIGPDPDANTIADAASSWDEDLSAGDPKWVTLSAVEQGGWINTWVAYETGELNAQGLAREYGAQLDKAKLQRANGSADADTGKPAGATGGAVPGSRTRGAVEQNLPVGPSDAGEKGSFAGAETQAGTGNRPVTPPTITVKKRRTIVKPEPDSTKFSTDRAGSGSTVDELYAEFAELGIRPNNRKVTVVQSVADVPQSMRKSVDNKSKVTASRVAAFVSGDRAWFIADNIAPGTGRAMFMHEVGMHLGAENLLTEDQLDNLFSTIIKWADRNDGSMESNLARQAIIRAGVAVTHDEQLQSEVMAYFVEEAVKAGIDPTAMSYKNELTRWFRTLYAAFKSAIRKLGWTNAADKLTAQDIVDLAYGAAKLEMDGTFHGSAAQFRKFNHEFMGTGEGAQAFGWGSYLAQRPGIAKGYWKADVARKATILFDGGNIAVAHKSASSAAKYPATPYSETPESLALSYMEDIVNDKQFYRSGAEALVDLQVRSLERIADGSKEFDGSKGGEYYRYKNAAIWLSDNKHRFTDATIEGSLMRVDVNITDDELLDWDAPLSEQSDTVKAALEKDADIVDRFDGKPFFNPYDTGMDAYKRLVKKLGSKKAASEYLDSLGVKGIKFLDAESRSWAGAKFKIVEAGPYRTQMEKAKPWIVDIEKDGGYQKMNFRSREEAEAWVEGVKNGATRNLVVFNDKNIYRVASAVGADRGRMKFSVDAAVKTNDTSVDTYIRKVAGRSGVQLKTNLQHQAKKLVRSMAFLHDLVDEYKGAMPAVTDWYNAIQSTMARKRQLEADAELIAADAMKLKNGTDKVNAFIADATTSQKWWKDVERQKDGETVKVEADHELKNRFRQLEPEERKIVEAVFAHGDKMLEIKYKLLKDLGLDGVMLGTGKLPGPYAPLKRFGNYVTVLKSQALVDAEMAEDAAKAEELKKDPANYVVSFFDTLGQARMFAEDHSGKYAFTDYGEKQVRLGEELPAKHETLKRILDTIKVQNLPDEARVGMENLIREMYIQSLDEHHAATHGLTRKNTAGYETDMLRSFLSHARAEANFLAHLEYGGKVNNAFYEMQRQSRDRPGGKVVHRDALATLTRHYAENLNYKETPIQDRLMAFTSAWQLATSLGYHVANATQPVMTTVPKLASDFNDYAGAWKAVMDGYQTVKKTGVWGNIELDKVSDGGLRKALQRAADLGVLDVGMDEDLTHFEQTRTGFGVVDKASKVAKTALHNLRKVSRAVETANRVAAATAAYNMAKKHGMAEQAAQDYAVRMLETTQGDFSRTGAPLLLKKLPKIMTQYKKFQFMMMALYAKAYRQAFHGEDAETRAIGRRMLAFKLFHTSMAAGALGLPMMNLAGPVLARMLAGDEEPPDLERDLRKIIGDETMADMLLHGPLHFMGMDAKLGEEKIFSILPYADWDFSSASGALKTAAGLAGPAVSLGLKFASGVEAFEKGDIYKGVEKFMPSGAANALKAFRIANEGYTLKNGDVMFAPDDINGAALAFDFFGLPSSDMKRMDWLRGQQYELTQFYKDRTKAIAKQYTDAVKDGDTDQASDAREAWMELQASKDRLRYLFGDSADELKRQPLSALMKYPKNQAEREQRLQRAAVVP